MSAVVRKRAPDNRLAKVLRTPGGRTVRDIDADVGARLGALRASCLDELRDHVAGIEQLGERSARPRSDAELDAVYRQANAVVGLSGVAGMDHVGEACLSLCRLVDGFRNGKPWNPAAFQVHVQSIQLLTHAGADLGPDVARATVDGLAGVVQKALR